jgi:hypothetical protein
MANATTTIHIATARNIKMGGRTLNTTIRNINKGAPVTKALNSNSFVRFLFVCFMENLFLLMRRANPRAPFDLVSK